MELIVIFFGLKYLHFLALKILLNSSVEKLILLKKSNFQLLQQQHHRHIRSKMCEKFFHF